MAGEADTVPEPALHPSVRPPPALGASRPEARELLREASLELARLRRIRGASHKTWQRIARAKTRLAFAAGLLAAVPAVDPALAEPLFSRGPLADVGSRASPELADIDGDGDLDAFVGNLHGDTLFFRNT